MVWEIVSWCHDPSAGVAVGAGGRNGQEGLAVLQHTKGLPLLPGSVGQPGARVPPQRRQQCAPGTLRAPAWFVAESTLGNYHH